MAKNSAKNTMEKYDASSAITVKYDTNMINNNNTGFALCDILSQGGLLRGGCCCAFLPQNPEKVEK
jgi:hypothetical protein